MHNNKKNSKIREANFDRIEERNKFHSNSWRLQWNSFIIIMDRTRQKISKEMEDFSNTIVQLDLNDTQLLPRVVQDFSSIKAKTLNNQQMACFTQLYTVVQRF